MDARTKLPFISITDKYAERVLTPTELRMILNTDEVKGWAPGQSRNMEEVEAETEEIIKNQNLENISIRKYCEWRFPDEPETQYLIVLDNLCNFNPVEGPVYAVIEDDTVYDIQWLTRDLTIEEAKKFSTDDHRYIVPMEALKDYALI